MIGHLIFKDGTIFEGRSFGSRTSRAGEIVFSTGMVGYPESLTDPSYKGQILVMTYPLVGNYGVPKKKYWESPSIKVSGLIVSSYNDTPSHPQSVRSLSSWLKDEGTPALEIKDTRRLAQKLRDEGVSLGKLIIDNDISFYDPNVDNLVAKVSVKKISLRRSFALPTRSKTVLYIDCGGKKNMITCLQKRRVNVVVVPWNFDPFEKNDEYTLNKFLKENKLSRRIDGYVISNGPGDPKIIKETIKTAKKIVDANLPLLGICLGHQILTLATGGDTQKLKFGHRAQNNPCINAFSKRCYITTQNHGFAVSRIPPGFTTWFFNANDNTNEGIIHMKYSFMSVQFHPEATPGPRDTEWIFDHFLEKLRK